MTDEVVIEATGTEIQVARVLPTNLAKPDWIGKLHDQLVGIFPRDRDGKLTVPEKELRAVVIMALSMGVNPLMVGKSYHAYKDERGVLQVMYHYAEMIRRLRAALPAGQIFDRQLSKNEIEKLATLKDTDFVVQAAFVPDSDKSFYQEIYKLALKSYLNDGHPFDVARAMAKAEAFDVVETALGVVDYGEVYELKGSKWQLKKYSTAVGQKGWVPGWTRATIRAYRNLVRKMIGEASLADTIQEVSVAIKMDEDGRVSVEPDQVAQLVAETPPEILEAGPEIQEKWLQIAMANQYWGEQREQRDAGKTEEELRAEREKRLRNNPLRQPMDEALVEDGKDDYQAVYEEDLVEDDSPEYLKPGEVRNALKGLGLKTSKAQDDVLSDNYLTIDKVTANDLADLVATLTEEQDDNNPDETPTTG